MKLSERIAAGEVSAELDAAIAMAMGWAKEQAPHNDLGVKKFWKRGKEARWTLPIYRTDIRLTLAEIERKGWDHSSNSDSNGCGFVVWGDNGFYHEATRTDRNLDLAALDALLKAMGE